MRIAVCDDDERESAFLSKMIKEYQLSRGGGVLTASFFIMVRIFCVTGRAGNTTLFC